MEMYEGDVVFCLCLPDLETNVAEGLLGLAVGARLLKTGEEDLALAHLSYFRRGAKPDCGEEVERIEKWLGYPIFENFDAFHRDEVIGQLMRYAASKLNRLPADEDYAFWNKAFQRELRAMEALAAGDGKSFLQTIEGMKYLAPRWVREGEEFRRDFRPPEGEGWTGPVWEHEDWAFHEGWKNGWYFLWKADGEYLWEWDWHRHGSGVSTSGRRENSRNWMRAWDREGKKTKPLGRWTAYRGSRRVSRIMDPPFGPPIPETMPYVKYDKKGVPKEAGYADLEWILKSRTWTEEELNRNKSWACKRGPREVLKRHQIELPLDPGELSDEKVKELVADYEVREFLKFVSRKGDTGAAEKGGEVVLAYTERYCSELRASFVVAPEPDRYY